MVNYGFDNDNHTKWRDCDVEVDTDKSYAYDNHWNKWADEKEAPPHKENTNSGDE